MNRDELRSRPDGDIHQNTTAYGIDYLFPVDPLSGGTWFGINACGIGACLLNGYGDTHLHNRSEIISRGTIIPRILECRNFQDAFQLIDQLPLQHFRNFDLFLFDTKSALQFTHENGVGIVQRRKGDWVMLTSSSWNKDAVLEYRQHSFNEYISGNACCPDVAESVLRDFHLSDSGDRRFSVLMSRKESHTKSVSQIVLNNNTIRFHYLDEQAVDRFGGAICANDVDSLGKVRLLTRKT